jgi:hypothetical protein
VRTSTQRALENADWHLIGRELAAHAQRLLNVHTWRTGSKIDVAGGREARDFAHEAIAKMSGYDAERGPLLPYLKALVERSISNLSKSAENRWERSIRLRRDGDGGAPEELQDYIERHQKEVGPSAEDLVSGPGERVSALFEAVDGDEGLTALLDAAMQTGETTAQPLAKHLGTTTKDINNRIRKLRRVAAKLTAEPTRPDDSGTAKGIDRTTP